MSQFGVHWVTRAQRSVLRQSARLCSFERRGRSKWAQRATDHFAWIHQVVGVKRALERLHHFILGSWLVARHLRSA